MILGQDTNEVTLSNVTSTGEFRIRNSAKAFSILSSGLYSNKIKAIIRELSCNALDSHVAAGKAELPFEVHLPSMLEPWFSVKDFGLGLDGNQVTNIYTTYFESTKTDSNEFIGALGLGSKSPFSYTENFTITAVKDCMKRIYSAFINDIGVPSIAEMNSEPTADGNGVEVKFSVTDRHDYNSFAHEAQAVFKWFKHKPTVEGTRYEHDTVAYEDENIVPGVHKLRSGSSSFALMGNILYPLNNISEPEKHFGYLAPLLSCGLLIEFDIGDLDFAASREELSYVPMTINSIKRKLTLLNSNLESHLAGKVAAIEGDWAKAEFLYERTQSKLYGAAVLSYVANTKFELYDATVYRGQKIFSFEVPTLTARGLDIAGMNIVGGSYRNKISEHTIRVLNKEIPVRRIGVDSNVVIVLNDLKTGIAARARYHYCSHNDYKSAAVYCVSHTSTDLAVRQLAYDKFIKELHNPPTVVMASSLEKKEKIKSTLSSQGILTYDLKEDSNYRSYYNRTKSYHWQSYTDTLESTETYYYVCLNNYEPETLEGHAFNALGLRKLMDKSGIPALANVRLFGVRKNRIKDIKDLPNWVWIEEKIIEETAKVADAHVLAVVSSAIFNESYNAIYMNPDIVSKLPADSSYAQFYAKYGKVKSVTGDASSLAELCGKYGKVVEADKVTKTLSDARDILVKKYPLLKHISYAPDAEIATYIKLVDLTSKI